MPLAPNENVLHCWEWGLVGEPLWPGQVVSVAWISVACGWLRGWLRPAGLGRKTPLPIFSAWVTPADHRKMVLSNAKDPAGPPEPTAWKNPDDFAVLPMAPAG